MGRSGTSPGMLGKPEAPRTESTAFPRPRSAVRPPCASVGVSGSCISAQPLCAHPSPTGPSQACCTAHPTCSLLPRIHPLDLDSKDAHIRISHPDLSHRHKPTIPRACWTHSLATPLATDTFTCQHQSSHFPCLPVNSFSRVPQLRADHPSSCPSKNARTTLDYSFLFFHLPPLSLSVPPWTGPLASVARTTATLLP